MKNETIRRILAFGATALMLGLVFGSAVDAGDKQVVNMTVEDIMPQNMNNAIINITAEEAYNMLNTTGDGIQIPIDVRRENEWKPERIDTPIPEHPRWYLLDLIKNVSILPKFLFQYDQCDIILYCKGGYRSYIAAKTIENANFTGTIYNMLGGITEWKAQGLPTAPGDIYNITVEEAWDLLTSTLNGVQIPIDIRSFDEWNTGYLDTPWPECPIWFNLDLLKDPLNQSDFKLKYIGNEVILYCKGGYRSLIGSYELYFNNFNGTQYNMLGGITAWIAAGLPIRNNTPPNIPEIGGRRRFREGEDGIHPYTIYSIDPDGDALYYLINWSDGPAWGWIGPYVSGEEFTINVTIPKEKGTYFIFKIKAKDSYGGESDWAILEVIVTRSKAIYNSCLLKIFERFPILQLLLDILR